MIRITTLLLCTALLLAGCGEESKKKAEELGQTVGEKAGEAWNKVKTFTAEQKDEAVKLWDANKDGLAERYEKVKDKSGELSEDARTTLAERWKDVEGALAKAKEAGKDGWAAARDGVTAAYEAFQRELAKHE